MQRRKSWWFQTGRSYVGTNDSLQQVCCPHWCDYAGGMQVAGANSDGQHPRWLEHSFQNSNLLSTHRHLPATATGPATAQCRQGFGYRKCLTPTLRFPSRQIRLKKPLVQVRALPRQRPSRSCCLAVRRLHSASLS